MLKPAPGRCAGILVTGLPTIVNGIPKPVPLTGMPVETEAESDARNRLHAFASSCS